MRSFVVLLLAAAALGAPASDLGTAQTRTANVEIGAGDAPQPFSARCQPGEQLIGGGFASVGTELRVVSSFPSGTDSWTVAVFNPTKRTLPFSVTARCLAGSSGKVTVATSSSTSSSARADCPNGTVVTGGGFRSPWTLRRGGMIVSGSHPRSGNGWGVEAVFLPADSQVPGTRQMEAFALCLDAAEAVPFAPVTMDLVAGQANCLTTPTTAAVCTYPRTGSQKVTCAAQEVLSATGYEVATGTPPNFGVITASAGEVVFTGVSRDASPLTLRITPVCLRAPPVAITPTTLAWPLWAGAGALLLVALLATYFVRSRSKPVGLAGIDVVVRTSKSSFRHDRFREVP